MRGQHCGAFVAILKRMVRNERVEEGRGFLEDRVVDIRSERSVKRPRSGGLQHRAINEFTRANRLDTRPHYAYSIIVDINYMLRREYEDSAILGQVS